jgi:hypothetical protein
VGGEVKGSVGTGRRIGKRGRIADIAANRLCSERGDALSRKVGASKRSHRASFTNQTLGKPPPDEP